VTVIDARAAVVSSALLLRAVAAALSGRLLALH
jgi:hypothetical protein